MYIGIARFRLIALILSAVVVVAVLVFNYVDYRSSKQQPTDFASCLSAGFPILESYPRRCTAGEQVFVEDISAILEKDNVIRVLSPLPNATVSSPLVVSGMARGVWFFEGSFPIELSFGTGTTPVIAIATAGAPWMTEEFVPFTATLVFDDAVKRGAVITFKKDNPSGLTEYDDSLSFSLNIVPREVNGAMPPVSNGGCVVTGCSSQLCAEEEMITTCEYIPTYACYSGATCARQTDGTCGWTMTTQLVQCLNRGGIVE